MKKSAILAVMFLGFCGAAQAAGLDLLAVNAAGLMKVTKTFAGIPEPGLAPAEEPVPDFSLEVFNHVCAKESAALAKLGLDAKARAYGFDSGDLDLESMIVEGMTREGGFIYTLTGYIYKGEYFITVVTDSSCAAEAVTIKERLDGEAMAPAQQAFRKTGKVSAQGAQVRSGDDTRTPETLLRNFRARGTLKEKSALFGRQARISVSLEDNGILDLDGRPRPRLDLDFEAGSLSYSGSRGVVDALVADADDVGPRIKSLITAYFPDWQATRSPYYAQFFIGGFGENSAQVYVEVRLMTSNDWKDTLQFSGWLTRY